MTDPTIKTYVLAGDDPSGTFSEANEEYRKKGIEVIHAKPEESIEQALGQIKGPANIIIDAHGDKDSSITWNKAESISYEQLFKALPREGIESVTIASCYGGSAEKEHILKAAPEGTVVQSMVGAENCGDSRFITELAQSVSKGANSTELFLDSLAVFNPAKYEADATEWNKSGKYGHLDTNPETALPHILGIGGLPPIDMQTEMEKIKGSHALETSEGKAAIEEVRERFRGAHSENNKIRQDFEIEAVARKLESGQAPQGAEEKRIAYALTAAYMEKSGELEQKIETAKHHPVGAHKIHPKPLKQTDEPEAKTSVTPEMPHAQHTEPRAEETPRHAALKLAAELAALNTEVFDDHKLVTARHQSSAQTNALEEFAKTMHIQGVRTDAPELSKDEIKAIQRALHVKDDGLIGTKTMTAMNHAEEVHALPTPVNPAVQQKHQLG